MITKAINNLKSDNGSGLVLSLMVLLALSVLGSALGIVTVGSHKLSDINRDHTSAYYVAEAGANMAYEEIKENVKNIGTDEDQKGIDIINKVDNLYSNKELEYIGENYFRLQSGSVPRANVIIRNKSGMTQEDNVFSQEFIIESTGNIKNKTRTVIKPFKVSWVEKIKKKSNGNSLEFPENAAIIFNTEIDYGENNNVSIIGDVIGSQTASEKGSGNDLPKLERSNLDWKKYSEYVLSIPKDAIYLKNYEYQTREDGVTGNIDKIVIDTNGKTVNIISKTLENSFEVINGGQVNLYIENIQGKNNKYDLNVGKNSNPNQLNVFYSGPSFEFGQGATLNGMLFAPNASVEFKNSANVNGIIIANKIKFGNKSGVNNPTSYNLDYPSHDSDPIVEESNEVELIRTQSAIEQ